ncbi:MAG: tol-pal system protein YbgF [bacterium]
MTAGSLRRAALGGCAVLAGLLAVTAFLPGCGLHSELVRQGVVLDSLAVRNDRIEREQTRQGALHAQQLAEIARIQSELAALDARLIDLNERLARIGRRLGVWQTAAVPDEVDSALPGEFVAVPDTTPVRPDTVRTGIDPDQLYNTAYLDFTRGKHQVAIAGFEQFIQLFPDSEMADNAQYWIGECYYSMGELNRSEEEFKKVLIRYPAGNKVPAATYKLGLVYLAQNRPDAARRQFEAVVEKYPGSTEAKLAGERLTP